MIFDLLTEEQKEKVISLETTRNNTPSLNINRNIDIKTDYFTVIEEVKQIIKSGDKTTYGYYYIIKCNNCGSIKKINKNCLTDSYKTCQHCNAIKAQQAFVGFENKTYKVLAFDRLENRKLYYLCECKNCGSKHVVRKDNILDCSSGKCKNCKGNSIKITEEAPINVYYSMYRTGALDRNLNFDLTKEEFKSIINKPCYYCGALPTEIQSLKKYNKTNKPCLVNGVDRIVSNLGYSKDNCVPCCSVCNRMKSDYSLDMFLKHIESIYLNRVKSSTTISKESTPKQVETEGIQ